MAKYGKPTTYGGVAPDERMKKWETEPPRAENAIWNICPGYDLIPEVDLPLFHSFFLDSTHSAPPLTPLYSYQWVRNCGIGNKLVNCALSLPNCYGWEWRFKDGGLYVTFLIVKDLDERRQREIKFKEAIKPYLEDFSGIWEQNKRRLNVIYDHLKQFDLDNATPLDYLHHIWDLDEAFRTMYEIHFFGMQTSYSAWILLEDECKRRFGWNDQCAEFQDMMRGFDNEIYRVDRELWQLAKDAVQMNLTDTFKAYGPEELLLKLEQDWKGKEWMKKFNDFLQIRGWRTVRMVDLVDPYWLEKPSLPLATIRDHILTGSVQRDQYILDEKRAEFGVKREKAVAEMLDRLPAHERGWFNSLIKLGQCATQYSEEHDLFCELTVQALMRRGYLAIGKRLADGGCIDQPEDVFMMNPMEIESCIQMPEVNDFRWITRPRRTAYDSWINRFAAEGEFRPPLYTDRPGGLPEAVEKDLLPSMDPICIKIIIGDMPVVRPELNADLFGLCGCPGEAEGIARVIVNYNDLNQLQPGDILVCPGTNPAWTPAFAIAGAVIADRGGTLSHTAIIGREYGVPTIMNTFVGSQQIKTGQRVRVDATNGAIYILDK